MKAQLILLYIALSFLHACAKPKATVFEDQRLAQEEEVKFCMIGDLGQDTEHQKAIADSLEREDCHRIFMLGDLVYSKGIKSLEDPELEQKFLKFYQPLLDRNPRLIIPLMLGNHDHQGKPSAWLDLAKNNPGFFMPNYYYFIDYGGLCMVALDTSFYHYNDKVQEGIEQSTWLTKLEPRLKDCDVKIAMSHHPFKGGDYPGSKDWKGAEGSLKVFLDTYVIGKFDLHVAGHVHVLENDGIDEGTRMLISGTGGENRGDGQSGYVVLRWDPANPKRIGFSMRKVDVSPTIVDDSVAQKQEEHEEWDDRINKTRVEEPWYRRLFSSW